MEKVFFFKVNNGIVLVWKYMRGKLVVECIYKFYNMFENKNGKYFLFKYIVFIIIIDCFFKVGIINVFIIKNLFCIC